MPGPKPTWQLSVVGTTPDVSGLVYEKIVVTTDSERFPKLEIPVVLTIEGGFIREPRSIVQVLHTGGTVTPCHLVLRHGKQIPWRVDGIKTEGLDAQEIKIKKCDAGESIEKTIVVTAIPPVKPSFSVKKGSLLIKAAMQGRQELIRVPVLNGTADSSGP